ncbi:MAG: hypothetical protein K8R59_13295 [Thermoanaerobaculales bacterium]|nr:hypothetical protein [Thermoanaerobaculales bacterium]
MDSSLNDLLDDVVDDAEENQNEEARSRGLDADAILDTLVPSSVDWKDTVRNHPMMSVAGVGIVGYLVGRTKGSMIMAGLTAALSTALTRQLGDVFEGDFFDF